MGTIQVHEFTTMDGVIDEPRWTFDFGFDPKMGAAIGKAMGGCQGILLGRVHLRDVRACLVSKNSGG